MLRSERHCDWPSDCKIYIGNLGRDILADLGEYEMRRQIQKSFTQFGRVINIWIAKRPPGFAFVLMEDFRDAEDAVRALDGSRMCDRKVWVQRYQPGRKKREGGRGKECEFGDDGRGPRYSCRSRESRSRSRSRSRNRSKSRSRSRIALLLSYIGLLVEERCLNRANNK